MFPAKAIALNIIVAQILSRNGTFAGFPLKKENQ
jgi:hypothetical protein